MKQKFSILLLSLIVVMSTAIPASALADVQSDPLTNKINVVQDPGGKFDPQAKLDFASGIAAIVKDSSLSLNGYYFFKAPKASDYFTNIKDSAWYADAFVIAQVNGLSIPKDITADQPMTRELYAHLLAQAIAANGDYPVIARFNIIKDGDSITSAYNNSIQQLLNSGVSLLDDKLNFNPQSPVTKSVAARWLKESVDVMKNIKNTKEMDGSPLQDYTLTAKLVDDKVNEITVSAQAPHPGYSLRIFSIVFDQINKQATIFTEVVHPKVGSFYAQVITEVRATTYVPAGFKAVLAVGSTSSSNAQ